MKNRFELPFNRPYVGSEEIAAMTRVVQSGWLTTGQETLNFERELCEHFGLAATLAVNSCTAALHIAADLAGVGPGTQVIVPSYTFVATAEVVEYLGGEVVMVDSDPETLQIDLAAVKKNLNSKTRAVMAVNMFGHPAPLKELRELTKNSSAKLILDAAHSTEGKIDGQSVSHFADFTCLSFYANKNLTTGEGGALVLDRADEELIGQVRQKILHGMNKDAWKRFGASGSWFYEVTERGYKYNLTDVAAAMGREQIKKFPRMTQLRRQIVDEYVRTLATVQGVRAYAPWQKLAEIESRGIVPALHLFPVFLASVGSPQQDWERKSRLVQLMKDHGVTCSVHYTPLHRMPYYRDKYQLRDEAFPVTTAWSAREITLPLFPGMTLADVHGVVDALRASLAEL